MAYSNPTPTVYQGAAPWLVNASVIGVHGVTASIQGTPNINLTPVAVGGWSSFAASVVGSLVTISTAAGKFGGYMLINYNPTPAYIELFDVAATATLGVNKPTMLFPFPAATTVNGIGANLELANGAKISNGIQMGVVSQIGTASVVATGVSGTVWYV